MIPDERAREIVHVMHADVPRAVLAPRERLDGFVALLGVETLAGAEDARERAVRIISTEITAAEARGESRERERWRAAAKALVDAMPKCGECDAAVATTNLNGSPSHIANTCDACAEPNAPRGYAPDLDVPYAPALRALLALLETP